MEIIDTPEKVFENVSNLIETSKFKLDYKIVDETYLTEIVEFINMNFLKKDETFSLVYSTELIKYYLIDSLPILFYAKNNPDKIVGLIIGKFTNVMAFDKKIEALDGNYMCLIPQLRNLHISKLIIAYLVREGLKINKIPIKFGYYGTAKKIIVEEICIKKYFHRFINLPKLIKLEQVPESYKKYSALYSRFVYPDNFKQFKINNKIELNEIDEITNKINLYQKEHLDIYKLISNVALTNINNSEAFLKFVIKNNNNIEAFIAFYKMDIFNANLNESVNTLYLCYYFVNGNVIDYLELVGEYIKKI